MSDLGISRFGQVKIYVGKHFRLFKNEKGWKMLIFAAIISALVSSVLGSGMFVYDMDTFSGAFALVSACIWIGIFNSIQTICKERAIIKREHRTGLHISSYVISHLIYQAVICIVQALILLVISAIFLHYPTVKPLFLSIYLEYFVTYFLITYSADVLGLAISSIVRTPATAMTVMPFILIIQLILSGMLFTLEGTAGYIADFTISKWGLNATCISSDYNQLESLEKLKMQRFVNKAVQDEGLPLDKETVYQLVEDNYTTSVNETYVHTFSNLLHQWLILILHTVVYAVVSILSLELVDRDRR
ncbi:MAG: ABC transporter permease [Fusicatenibacter sp.]